MYPAMQPVRLGQKLLQSGIHLPGCGKHSAAKLAVAGVRLALLPGSGGKVPQRHVISRIQPSRFTIPLLGGRGKQPPQRLLDGTGVFPQAIISSAAAWLP